MGSSGNQSAIINSTPSCKNFISGASSLNKTLPDLYVRIFCPPVYGDKCKMRFCRARRDGIRLHISPFSFRVVVYISTEILYGRLYCLSEIEWCIMHVSRNSKAFCRSRVTLHFWLNNAAENFAFWDIVSSVCPKNFWIALAQRYNWRIPRATPVWYSSRKWLAIMGAKEKKII